MAYLLEVDDLHTFFKTKKGIVKAVNGVSYRVEPGKTLGIVGESGSGKSVSAMSILKLLDGNGYIDSGTITFKGRNLAECTINDMYQIRGNEISVIFQEPMTSLNPVYTIEKQLNEVYLTHQKITKKEASEKSLEMLKAVKIPNPESVMKQFPHQLSGGMRQRVMIAMALACEPSLLIADEPTTALDVTIQAQILKLMNELKKEKGTSILFITHDLGVINQMADEVAVMYCGQVVEMCKARTIFAKETTCSHPYTEDNLAYLFISHGLSVVKYISDRIGVMYLGNIVELAESQEMFDHPTHPYTEALLSAIPTTDVDSNREMIPLEGDIPSPVHPPKGCKFHTRCKYCTEICKHIIPELVEMRPGHFVACHNPLGVEKDS